MKTRRYRWFCFLVTGASLLLVPAIHAQIPGRDESHIDANVPAPDFNTFLTRDLTARFKQTYGEDIVVTFQLLRETPTQTGLAYPKLYLWAVVRKPDKTLIVEGAARVAAIEKKSFEVTNFISRSEILADPDSLARVFPQPLLEKIKGAASREP